MKKYELTTETKVVSGHTLYRIRALVAFGSVDTGELGGWIENEMNLARLGLLVFPEGGLQLAFRTRELNGQAAGLQVGFDFCGEPLFADAESLGEPGGADHSD